ncbi:MAG TPA: YdcF family protein [Stellaceae bacterium]|nr:YdcF family protein [Stellaceae bacterium]
MFLVGKLVWAVIEPGNLLLLLLLAGVLRGWRSRRRGGDFLVRLAALAFLLLAALPIGPALLLPLEVRFAPPRELPRQVAGIVVLGGAVSPRLSKSYGGTVFSGSPARLLAGVELARRYPQAKLAILGGEGSLVPIGYAEAAASLPFLLAEGIARRRIVLEEKSRSTHENARFGKRLLQPKPAENWIVVTSAFHMPRAVGCFRAVGWPVIPYPVDFTVDPGTVWRPDFSLLDGLTTSTTAGKEWVGLAAYRIFGWTRELFPGPAAAAPPGAAAARGQSPWNALKAESAVHATNIVTPVQYTQ